MKLTGSQILIECLVEQGVDTVFGYPGGSVLNIYDELYKNSDRITHILTAHEQGASHAADGYARASGKVGVCIATSGPGATNLVTGIATAYLDSVPVVFITGNVNVSLIGKDSFQGSSSPALPSPSPSTTTRCATSRSLPIPCATLSKSRAAAARVRSSSTSRRTSPLRPANSNPRKSG